MRAEEFRFHEVLFKDEERAEQEIDGQGAASVSSIAEQTNQKTDKPCHD